jgi:hypothetical protein
MGVLFPRRKTLRQNLLSFPEPPKTGVCTNLRRSFAQYAWLIKCAATAPQSEPHALWHLRLDGALIDAATSWHG